MMQPRELRWHLTRCLERLTQEGKPTDERGRHLAELLRQKARRLKKSLA